MTQSIVRAVVHAVVGAVIAASLASPCAAAKQQVLVEYRVLSVKPDSLATLGLARSAAGQVDIALVNRTGHDFDVAIEGLEATKQARVISRPMIMVQAGERAAIESTGAGHLKLQTRVNPVGSTFAVDLVLELASDGQEPVAIQRDGIAIPASIVRCPGSDADVGECLVVLVHAQAP